MNDHKPSLEYWEYEQTGGLRYGYSFLFATNASIPLAHLHVSQKQLSIRVGLGKSKWEQFTLPRERVRSVSMRRGLFGTGVQFEHDQRGTPPCLVFWPTNRERLLGELRSMGYPVA
jgi:hypothetical protein